MGTRSDIETRREELTLAAKSFASSDSETTTYKDLRAGDYRRDERSRVTNSQLGAGCAIGRLQDYAVVVGSDAVDGKVAAENMQLLFRSGSAGPNLDGVSQNQRIALRNDGIRADGSCIGNSGGAVELAPMKVLLCSVVFEAPALLPIKVLVLPVVLLAPARVPKKELLSPWLLLSPGFVPKGVALARSVAGTRATSEERVCGASVNVASRITEKGVSARGCVKQSVLVPKKEF